MVVFGTIVVAINLLLRRPVLQKRLQMQQERAIILMVGQKAAVVH